MKYFLVAILGLVWMAGAALLTPGGEPFTNFFHVVGVGHILIGFGVTLIGINGLSR